MRKRFFDLAFTPAVREQQTLRGSRNAYSAMTERPGTDATADVLAEREIAFIQARDSFYLATVSATGWPYVQHRGGPVGFVRHLADGTLGWAEYIGNRQYVSIGNATTDDRLAMLFMDYPHQNQGRPAFPAATCTSVNEEVVHGIPTQRRLVEGDIVTVRLSIRAA